LPSRPGTRHASQTEKHTSRPLHQVRLNARPTHRVRRTCFTAWLVRSLILPIMPLALCQRSLFLRRSGRPVSHLLYYLQYCGWRGSTPRGRRPTSSSRQPRRCAAHRLYLTHRHSHDPVIHPPICRDHIPGEPPPNCRLIKAPTDLARLAHHALTFAYLHTAPFPSLYLTLLIPLCLYICPSHAGLYILYISHAAK